MRCPNLLAFLLIIFGSVTFFSCDSAKQDIGHREAKGSVVLGGTLKVAESSAPKTFLPFNITGLAEMHLGTQLHCGLLRFDPKTLEVIPGIAESWSVEDNGTSYVFNLRKGVKFHKDECFGKSSREVIANDFVYTFNQLCKPNGGKAFETTFKGRVKDADAYRNGETSGLAGVQAVDDYTLRIELVKPDPSLLYVLAQPSTAVISKVAYEKYAEQLKIGAGPFVWNDDEGDITLTRNMDYFLRDEFGNQQPYIDTLKVSIMETKQAQLEAFFQGSLDVVTHLYLDPVRDLLEEHVADFSGKRPKYLLHRDSEAAGYEVYTVSKSSVDGFRDNFMSYRDYSRVMLKE